MFGKKVVVDMINRSAENEADRRIFLRNAGLAGLGVVGATALSGVGSQSSPLRSIATLKAMTFATGKLSPAKKNDSSEYHVCTVR